jgi:hypothetical protein
MDFYQLAEVCTLEEKVARHEAAHFIVLIYLFVDNLPSITAVALTECNTNGKVEFPLPQVKESLYVCLAGYAQDSLIPGISYKLLSTEPNPHSDLDQYLTLYENLNEVTLLWYDGKTHEIVMKDFEETVKICTELENDINDFAILLLEKTIIEGELLTQQIEHYSKKYSK